jgi:hypothetical protein
MSGDPRKSGLVDGKPDAGDKALDDPLEFDALPDDDRLSLPARVPRIERMPEGIEVVENPVGRASAQWIVMVRCQCGRRWFEVEFIDTATCPRCGMFLVVELDGVPPSR